VSATVEAPVRRQLFERLVDEHRSEVARVCRSILRDEHLGADAAQEAFLRLWRALGQGEPPRSARAWLRRAATSAALDLARRRQVRLGAERAGALAPDARAAAGAPDTSAEGAELRAALEAALAELPPGQRTVFVLRHDGGLTLREVAETLDLALPTVKTQFARACLKLQAHLSAHRPGPGDES
jgi:RNA polymerase sigma-70 factor (ECF subfamily)